MRRGHLAKVLPSLQLLDHSHVSICLDTVTSAVLATGPGGLRLTDVVTFAACDQPTRVHILNLELPLCGSLLPAHVGLERLPGTTWRARSGEVDVRFKRRHIVEVRMAAHLSYPQHCRSSARETGL